MRQLTEIKPFSATLVKNFAKLALTTSCDLLLHLPLRYIDETRITPIRDLRLGDSVQVQGEIVHSEINHQPRKALIARLADDSGQLNLRFLHFYPSQIKMMQQGKKLRVFGEVRKSYFGYEMVHPQCKVATDALPVSEKLTPIYPTTAGLSQPAIRKAIQYVLETESLAETLPVSLYQSLSLPSFSHSIHYLHKLPPSANLAAFEQRKILQWRRLAFDELLAQQLSMRKHYAKRRSINAPAIAASNLLVKKLLAALPFQLTNAQQKVIKEISHDLAQPHPMQRLLQGDVGSGKTIVACIGALQAIEHGWQVALMSPTEILAEQHYKKFRAWFAPLNIHIAWLAGGQTKKKRETALQEIASGTAQLVIGTHALFQQSVQFYQLGLTVIDEQHRFGVQQRLALRKKGEPEPHQLMMSATPIPRTLSMSYFADLDVSVIDELPPGRSPIVTKLVSDERRNEVLQRAHGACISGRQVCWVCPLIEESEALQLKTVTETFDALQSTLTDLNVGLVHGKMKTAEKQRTMAAFVSGEIQLLVATTVIEVGVDVPNASLMVIEHAERMGLSQLHQLRGRVGRGAAKSICVLMYQNKPAGLNGSGQMSEMAKARLKIIYENTDGFAIAQEDLNLRGPGEYLGTRQSGAPMLKIADLARDEDLLRIAKSNADALLSKHPQAVEAHLARWLSQGAEMVKV